MGRRRAAFAEGIAEEEQRYAQALRDIRRYYALAATEELGGRAVATYEALPPHQRGVLSPSEGRPRTDKAAPEGS